MGKRALVVSGGGSKGAFAVGVLKHLATKPNGVAFDIVTGTSTGALIAPLVVTGEIDVLEEIYTTVRTPEILEPLPRVVEMFAKGYVHHTRPLEQLVRTRLTQNRVDTIVASDVLAFYATVCLQTGRTTYFQTGRTPGTTPSGDPAVRVTTRDDLVRAIVASANQPVLMPAITIPPGASPPRQYVDGGVREYAPIEVALANGASEIVAILLNPEPEQRGARNDPAGNLPAVLLRAISLMTEEIGEGDLRHARLQVDGASYLATARDNARHKLGLSESDVRRIFPTDHPFTGFTHLTLEVVRPDEELESKFDTSGLEFDPGKMRQMMDEGEAIARRQWP